VMSQKNAEFELLLNRAKELRGHLCVGLPLGVKMGIMGLRLLHMEDAESRHNLVVFVENDKCPVDGIQVTTGCSAGSGKLKMLDYGTLGATFVDGNTGRGYRVKTRNDFMARARELAIEDRIITAKDKVEGYSELDRKIMMNAYMKMTPDELFDIQEVRVNWAKPLLPNRGAPSAYCSKCGAEIMDEKGVMQGGNTLCWPCAHGTYYESV
jgi:formylmethanofuran dehydrogenase subunit E